MVLGQHIIGIIVEIVYRKTTLLTIRRRTWTKKTPYTKVREAQQHRFKALYRLCRSLLPATPYFHPAIAVKGPHEPPGSYHRTHEQHLTLNFMIFDFRFVLRITIIGGASAQVLKRAKARRTTFEVYYMIS